MKVEKIEFDVFGRRLVVEASTDGWIAFIPGNEGKRRLANIPIPPELDADGIARYLDDLFHEGATPENPNVTIIYRNKP